LGLVKKKKVKEGYKCFPCRDSWDGFISSDSNLSSLETAIFSIHRKRHVYILVGTWSTWNPTKTPASIWKTATKEGGYNCKKPRISTATMRFAESIPSLFTLSSKLDENFSEEEGDEEESSNNNDSKNESSSRNNDSEVIVQVRRHLISYSLTKRVSYFKPS
jgi:hypothetical protein